MKHNGQNIITDRDITMTGDGFQGEELSGVLSDHQTRLSTLESNVKWIYKNGGVGSGSGGGGGQSTTWKVVVSRGDTGQPLVNNGNVNFPAPGNYTIRTQIYGGGTSAFRVKYNWLDQSRTVTVSKDDAFYTDQLLTLSSNGSISITVVNLDTGEPLVFTVNYIVTSYTFKLYYVYEDTKTEFPVDGSKTIFMSEVRERGLMAALEYSVSVDLLESGYSFTDWEGTRFTNTDFPNEDQYQIRGKSSGIIYLNLTSNTREFLSNNDNARFVQFSLNIHIILDGNTEEENISTMYLKDNLIPSGIYLKVFTSGGGLFNSSQLEETDIDGTTTIINHYPPEQQFSVGNAVFQLTPYYGSLSISRLYRLYVRINGEEYDPGVSTLKDQQARSIILPFRQDNLEYRVEFSIQTEGQTYTKTYYLFVKESTSSFDWYPSTVTPFASSYYRKDLDARGIDGVSKYTDIKMSVNDSAVSYNFSVGGDVVSSYDNYDQLLCLGIQLSSVNNTENPIASFVCLDDTGTLIIYQDRVKLIRGIGYESEIEIYFPMVDDFNEADYTYYHLISLYKKFELREGNNYNKRVYVYIDGVLEAAFSNVMSENYRFEKITLHPGNYYVNLIECTSFRHSDQQDSITYLTDNDILRFYYTYKEKILRGTVSETEINLFDAFNGLTLDSENHVMANGDIVAKIAQYSEVPVLLLTYTDDNGGGDFFSGGRYGEDNFKKWMDTPYNENSIIEKLSVTAKWCSIDDTELKEVTYNNRTAVFKITPQGSSTLGYRCKNWELYAPEPDTDSVNCIYSPNFDVNDTSTFLPEESFTLKADVVDSSHSNNNAIGDFVNKVTTPFYGARRQSEEARYKDWIKNCLSGFPVLLFIESRYKSSAEVSEPNKTDWFFLGIYNFNLGRKSYFNLGYKDVRNLETLQLSKGFNIYEIDVNKNNLLYGIGVAEIQGNAPFFDFSQYDPTVLFRLPSLDTDSNYMFGDLVSTLESNLKTKIENLVEKTAKGGGYVFSRIGKTFKTTREAGKLGYGYDEQYSAVDDEGIPKNQVPNYRFQATRAVNQEISYTELPSAAIEKDLTDLIIGDTNPEAPEYGPTLDYTSLCEYYTVCMAFGLVDSVQKNLNIKTWNARDNNPLWYLAFYDMDTCLGVSNAGAKISYFAFSDYWESVTDPETGLLKPAKIYRDFSPKNSEDQGRIGFFDIASSYIFAVAKYSYSVLTDLRSQLELHPSNLWGIWRNGSRSAGNRQRGCLSDSNYFIETYYAHHLNGVPLPAFNYNYLYKYFVKVNNGKTLDDINFPKFYGRKLYYTKNWLDGRFHLLDAYFNVNQFPDVLEPTNIPAPYAASNYVDSNNPDIYVLRDIFSTTSVGNQYSNLGTAVSINTKPYAPLIAKTQVTGNRYIFPADGNDCLVQFDTFGTQSLLFGGSALWETISTINPFITLNNTLYIDSKYFTDIIGSIGTCRSWTLMTPSIKNLQLTSGNYSGDIEFISDTTSNYPNLNTINISNTSISLDVDKTNFTSLTANNMTGGSISINNVSTLSSVSLDNSTLSYLQIPAWQRVITLSSLTCDTIYIYSNFTGATLTISGNTALRKLSFYGFTSVTIQNCNKLEEIYIEDTNILESITVNKSTNSTDSFKVGATASVVDLSSQTSLKSVVFGNVSMTSVILPDHSIDLPSSAFKNCKKLTYLGGAGSNYVANIAGSEVFRNCEKFTLKDADGNWSKLKLKYNSSQPNSSLKNLDYTFSIDLTGSGSTYSIGSLDLDAAIHFLDECCSGTNLVESANYLFHNQNIEYTLDDLVSDLAEDPKTSRICFKNLPKCKGFNRTLYNNRVYAYNRYMFTGLESTSDINLSYFLGMSILKDWEPVVSTRRVVYATIDFLYEIISKLTTFYGAYLDQGQLRFYFVDSLGNPLSTVHLSNVFNPISNGERRYPTHLRTLGAIEVESSQWIDFSNTINSNWTDAADPTKGLQVSGFFYSFSMYNYVIDQSLDNFFEPIVLTSIGTALSGISDTALETRVDMRHFINWEHINKCVNLFHSQNSDSFYGSLNFIKKVSKSDFLYIWGKILTNFQPSDSGGVSYLFKNCNIYDWTDSDERFYLTTNQNLTNQNIKNTAQLFYNCNVYISEGSSVPLFVSFDSNFLKPLPNLVNVFQVFTRTRWKHVIPFDFFQKRVENREVVLVQREGTTAEERIEATKYTYSYRKELSNIRSCFSDILLESVNGSPVGFDETASYNCGKLTAGDPRYMGTRIVDYQGNNYTEYYRNRDPGSTPIPLSIPEEETDFLNLEGTYTGSVLFPSSVVSGNGNSLNNVPLGADFNPNRLFVAPDILYGCSANSNVLAIFANTITSRQDEEDDNTGFAFTGIIPEHLLREIKSTRITNMFQALNIIPRKLGEIEVNGQIEEHYYFVPRSFTTNGSLATSFNFKLIIPGRNQHFYILLEDSIPAGTLTLSNSLPTTSSRRFFELNIGYHPWNVNNSGLWYHIMGKPVYDSLTGELSSVTSGIDMTRFNKLKLDNLINSGLSAFVGGDLFQNFPYSTWDRNRYLEQKNSSGVITSYVIQTGFSAYGGLCRSCSFYAPRDNDNFMYGATSTIQYNRVNSECIRNFNSITQENYTSARINFVDDNT